VPQRAVDPELAELALRDRVVAELLATYGAPPLHRPVRVADRFDALATMICYQQLAGSAAAAIAGRLRAALGGSVSPAAVLAAGPEILRATGLSGAKTASIGDLATKVLEGAVNLDRMGRLSDQEVIDELGSVRGIGPWTAHMFLLSTLGRKDIWPVGDLGVRVGFQRAWRLEQVPTPKELELLGEPFRPRRSAIAWWCWCIADQKVTPPGTTESSV
jgi:DNA-3-methyladenine glycosylase II